MVVVLPSSQCRSNADKVASMKSTKIQYDDKKGLNRVILALTLALASTAYGQNTSAARAKRQIVVSIPDRKLAVLENGVVLRTFPIAVGAPISPSPTGEFEIVTRLTEPTYYHSGVVIPAGPNNPLGPRWVGFNKRGYGIHGTNAPGSVGKAASHGCIRLRNRDIVQLFAMVRVGDAVEIRGERDEQIARIFGGEIDTAVLAQAHTATALGGGQ